MIIAGGQIFKIAVSRFVNVSEEEINLMKEIAIPRNTNHATKFGMTLVKGNRMAFCMRMRCWCGGNVQGVCPSFILALPISVFFAIFHMEAPENTQEFFSIAFL